MLLREAAKTFNWKLNYGGIALMWRGGCIIRSVFLGNIKTAFTNYPDLTNLLLDPFFRDAIHDCQDAWRSVVANAVNLGIPTPAFSTALAYYDGYRSAKLPANLIQVKYPLVIQSINHYLNSSSGSKRLLWRPHL